VILHIKFFNGCTSSLTNELAFIWLSFQSLLTSNFKALCYLFNIYRPGNLYYFTLYFGWLFYNAIYILKASFSYISVFYIPYEPILISGETSESSGKTLPKSSTSYWD